MVLGVLTEDNVESHIVFIFNKQAVYSAICALFCIFLILRYSSKSMNMGYRFHLLNITVFTLFCDLNITILTRFIQLTPASGGCFIGELGALTTWMDVDSVAQILVVSFLGKFEVF
jgi:hypothetical protein